MVQTHHPNCSIMLMQEDREHKTNLDNLLDPKKKKKEYKEDRGCNLISRTYLEGQGPTFSIQDNGEKMN